MKSVWIVRAILQGTAPICGVFKTEADAERSVREQEAKGWKAWASEHDVQEAQP